MKLIFHDRSGSPSLLSGEAMLTVERGGNFSLSVAAVHALKLSPESQALLAEDVDTNTWYLLFGKIAGQQTFTLYPRDRKGKALQFTCQPKARAYFEAHGIDRAATRSIRATIGLEPVRHEQLVLYPLVPRHATKTVATTVVNAEAPAAKPTESAPARPASIFTAEMDEALLDPDQLAGTLSQAWNIPIASLYARRSYLKKKAGENNTTEPRPTPSPADLSATTATPVPADVAGAPAAPDNETPDERMERLTDYWFEREIKQCPDAELAELVSLLADKPKKERDIVENQMLNRGKTEIERRKKNGGSRG